MQRIPLATGLLLPADGYVTVRRYLKTSTAAYGSAD
jgi:hypothetical protein